MQQQFVYLLTTRRKYHCYGVNKICSQTKQSHITSQMYAVVMGAFGETRNSVARKTNKKIPPEYKLDPNKKVVYMKYKTSAQRLLQNAPSYKLSLHTSIK